MTHDDSPFQSPQPETPVDDVPGLLEQPYVLLVIAAVVGHVITYGLIWAAYTTAGDLMIDTAPNPPEWVHSTFGILVSILMVLAPIAFLLGIVSVYLLSRQWDDRQRSATTALLAAIPVFTLVVATYVLLRSSRAVEE